MDERKNGDPLKIAFDFEQWFQWRLSRHTPKGETRRPGTFTLSEEDLLTDLVYDFRRSHPIKEKRAVSVCKAAIRGSECLQQTERGYCLKNEKRIRFDGMWRIISEER